MKTAGVILLVVGVLAVAGGLVGAQICKIRAFEDVGDAQGAPDPGMLADHIEMALTFTVLGYAVGALTGLAGLVLLIVGFVRDRERGVPERWVAQN
jgi:hypothetical protein